MLALTIMGILFAGGAAGISHLLSKEKFVSSTDKVLNSLIFAKNLAFQTQKDVIFHLWEDKGNFYCQLETPQLSYTGQNLINKDMILHEIKSIDDGVNPIQKLDVVIRANFGAQKQFKLRLLGAHSNQEKIIVIDSKPHLLQSLNLYDQFSSHIPSYPKEIIEEEAVEINDTKVEQKN